MYGIRLSIGTQRGLDVVGPTMHTAHTIRQESVRLLLYVPGFHFRLYLPSFIRNSETIRNVCQFNAYCYCTQVHVPQSAQSSILLCDSEIPQVKSSAGVVDLVAVTLVLFVLLLIKPGSTV